MPELQVNSPRTISIDSTGEVATFEVRGSWSPAYTVALHIIGDEPADYAVDFGTEDERDGGVTWFENDEYTYTDRDAFTDGWIQPEEWVRVRVTSAASAGSEATIYLARAE